MIDVRTRLPKEEAAVLIAAMDAARDQFGPPPPKPDPAGDCCEPAPGVRAYSKADALLDVARVFLNIAPQNRSGEDSTLVVVHVSADNLGRVPAGTSHPAEAVCQIENVGSIETATAQRLACDNPVLGAVVTSMAVCSPSGAPSDRSAQRNGGPLMIRDHGLCQYPGCHQTRHLKAHHLIPWIQGGRTDP
jgi:hypothetical protein